MAISAIRFIEESSGTSGRLKIPEAKINEVDGVSIRSNGKLPVSTLFSFRRSLSACISLANLSLNYFLSTGNEEETMPVDTCSHASLFITPLSLLLLIVD